MQTAYERDRESDDSDNDSDEDISADGYLVCLVDSLLSRLRGSSVSVGLGLTSSNSEGAGEGAVSREDGEAGNVSEGLQLVEDIEEISDPRAQRVPSPRISGGKHIF